MTSHTEALQQLEAQITETVASRASQWDQHADGIKSRAETRITALASGMAELQNQMQNLLSDFVTQQSSAWQTDAAQSAETAASFGRQLSADGQNWCQALDSTQQAANGHHAEMQPQFDAVTKASTTGSDKVMTQTKEMNIMVAGAQAAVDAFVGSSVERQQLVTKSVSTCATEQQAQLNGVVEGHKTYIATSVESLTASWADMERQRDGFETECAAQTHAQNGLWAESQTIYSDTMAAARLSFENIGNMTTAMVEKVRRV